MQYRKFGRTGLSISPIGLGTVNFSWLTNEDDSFAILDRALELGVNFIDTSNNYNAGQTEALLGRWFSQGGRRDKTVLATKVFSPPTEWGSKDLAKRTGSWVGPNERGLSAKNIRYACEASLKRLQTDHIDVYQMHHVDRNTPWEEIWQAFELLVQQGKVLYVGSSNFAAWHIAQAQELARQRPFMGLVSEQSLYNLLRRTVELEVIPACTAYGLAFLPYSPLGGGALGGTPGDNEKGRRNAFKQSETIAAYQQFCASIGAHRRTLHWPGSRGSPASPHRSSARGRWPSSTRAALHWKFRSTTQRWRGSMNFSRDPAARRPRRTPGKAIAPTELEAKAHAHIP